MKKTKTIFFFTAALFLLASCKKEKNDTACPAGTPDPNCFCPTYYAPVCGCDKITYDNVCSAACAGITTYAQGKCP